MQRYSDQSSGSQRRAQRGPRTQYVGQAVPYGYCHPPCNERSWRKLDLLLKVYFAITGTGAQVSWYSGPSPPSGSVSRPPLAVVPPHWTQFEAVTWTSTSAAPFSSCSSGIS